MRYLSLAKAVHNHYNIRKEKKWNTLERKMAYMA